MSSSSMPASKRRRVDAANETLKKPFRSPVVKRPQPQGSNVSATGSPTTPAVAQRAKSTGLSRLSTPSKPLDRRRIGPALPDNGSTTPSRPALRHAAGQKLEPKIQAVSDRDAELLNKLSRRRKEAELKARVAEREMELIEQAARIQSGQETTNEDLEKLVRKWKGACRGAAEELFELIRGRVDSMGGGDAWRESRQHQAWFNEERTAGKRKQEGGEEDADEGADNREELEGLEEVQGSEDGVEQDPERDFTMHMMLKSLSIDPQLIGYDPVEDKWRDWG